MDLERLKLIDVANVVHTILRLSQMLWRGLRIVAEPGGAAAFSAILSGAYRPAPGERLAVIVSGGNTAAVNFDATY